MAYDKEKALLERLNNKSQEELIEIILKKNKQIDRLNNKLDNAYRYKKKMQECIIELKGGKYNGYYSQHYYTNPNRIE